MSARACELMALSYLAKALEFPGARDDVDLLEGISRIEMSLEKSKPDEIPVPHVHIPRHD